uniref:Pentatricopeptide repeat-containing protein n=1 Tax=Kalanchoe fedtschenkoi TaxID=63787 RepID=A0A7N0T4D4_KALFE
MISPFPKTQCSNLSSLLQGRIPATHLHQIHARVILLGAHHDNLIATRLIGHYPPPQALKLLRQLAEPNVFSFNAAIRVLSESGSSSSDAFRVFIQLKRRPVNANDFTYSFLLKACFKERSGICARQVHGEVVKTGFGSDGFVCNGLILAYGKAVRDLSSARKMFDEMPDKGFASCWTGLIAGLAQAGMSSDVLEMFLAMVRENVRPGDDTMVSVLSACSNLKMDEAVKWVDALELEFDADHSGCTFAAFIDLALVYLHGRLGNVERSRRRFDAMLPSGKRSVLAWNAIMGAYAHNGFPAEALSVFRLLMKDSVARPNHVTMVSVLSACAQIGDLELGRWVHCHVKYRGCKDVLQTNAILATALIDMYSKCGRTEDARQVFEEISSKDIVSFNAMIMGLAMSGEGCEALRLFSEMGVFGLAPNEGTYLGLLSACSHSGLLSQGRRIFSDMRLNTAFPPKLEHYACYIDLLARTGLIEEALETIESMPYKPNDFVWGALLSGCLLHSKPDLAQDISQRLVRADPKSSAGYVMMSNAYAGESRWGEVSGMRLRMKEKGVAKQPGRSWVSVDGVVHEFLAGLKAEDRIEEMCWALDALAKEMKAAAH